MFPRVTAHALRLVHRRAMEEDGWMVLVFCPESERDKRHVLWTTLTRLGFGTAAPGVWIAPGHLTSETCEVLARRGLAAYVEIFEGHARRVRGAATPAILNWTRQACRLVGRGLRGVVGRNWCDLVAA